MGGKVHIYVMDTITHVGEFLYRGRFFDDLYQVHDLQSMPNRLTKIQKSNKV